MSGFKINQQKTKILRIFLGFTRWHICQATAGQNELWHHGVCQGGNLPGFLCAPQKSCDHCHQIQCCQETGKLDPRSNMSGKFWFQAAKRECKRHCRYIVGYLVIICFIVKNIYMIEIVSCRSQSFESNITLKCQFRNKDLHFILCALRLRLSQSNLPPVTFIVNFIEKGEIISQICQLQ